MKRPSRGLVICYRLRYFFFFFLLFQCWFIFPYCIGSRILFFLSYLIWIKLQVLKTELHLFWVFWSSLTQRATKVSAKYIAHIWSSKSSVVVLWRVFPSVVDHVALAEWVQIHFILVLYFYICCECHCTIWLSWRNCLPSWTILPCHSWRSGSKIFKSSIHVWNSLGKRDRADRLSACRLPWHKKGRRPMGCSSFR